MHDFSPAEPRWDLPYASQRMPTFARRGMVATSQVLAAQAGVEILARGGSAADAAVATAACMTVLEPTTNGIGGDAFALVWNAGALHGLNGSGRSPAALDRTRYKRFAEFLAASKLIAKEPDLDSFVMAL